MSASRGTIRAAPALDVVEHAVRRPLHVDAQHRAAHPHRAELRRELALRPARADRRTGQMSSFTQTETTIEAIDLALATLDKLHESGARADDARIRQELRAGPVPAGAGNVRRNGRTQLATLEFYGLDRRYIDDYSAQLAAVTPADAKQVIDEVFPPSDGARARGHRQCRRDPRGPAQVRPDHRNEARGSDLRAAESRMELGRSAF